MSKQPTSKELEGAAARLDSHAQNEEMVDVGFTLHGEDCLLAAAALRYVARVQGQEAVMRLDNTGAGIHPVIVAGAMAKLAGDAPDGRVYDLIVRPEWEE